MQRVISNLTETELVQIALNDDENKKPISLQKSGSPKGNGLLRPNRLRNIDSNLNFLPPQRAHTEPNRPSPILNISRSPNSQLTDMIHNDNHKLFSMG